MIIKICVSYFGMDKIHAINNSYTSKNLNPFKIHECFTNIYNTFANSIFYSTPTASPPFSRQLANMYISVALGDVWRPLSASRQPRRP